MHYQDLEPRHKVLELIPVDMMVQQGKKDSCKSRQMRKIEDEYHFLFVCPNYRELRMQYLKTILLSLAEYTFWIPYVFNVEKAHM